MTQNRFKVFAQQTSAIISPLDDRYAEQTQALAGVLGGNAFYKYRVLVEIRWLQKLTSCGKLPAPPVISPISPAANAYLEGIITNFSAVDLARIKELEKETNHDVKAIEYFVKEKVVAHPELQHLKEFVHFACTSEDINNIAYGLMIKDTLNEIMMPILAQLRDMLEGLASDFAGAAMPARTHGQYASPTTMGKEFINFADRLRREMDRLRALPIDGKWNGAVGNHNEAKFTYPSVNWLALNEEFVTSFGLSYERYTTQIISCDYMVNIFDAMRHINNILKGFDQDLWQYISDEYFSLKVKQGETGSSVMPQKVNPIDFENSEGNLSLASGAFYHLSEKLTSSRKQRDLSNSPVLRSMGVPFGHSLVAFHSLLRGLTKIIINPAHMTDELNAHWEVLAPAIQMVMRRYGVDKPYERLKDLTRGNREVTKEVLAEFIGSLPETVPAAEKQRLLALTPETYLGYAATLAKMQ